MVCIIMDDRSYHRVFGRLLMNKEKELKEHIEVFREYINSFAVYKENSTDAVNNQ